ncbi:MAG: protein-ADP-ribose hydrolase, partial [Clostridiales bacterium]|nr:protein-ADP-ribose hydrolase [Clostridiales bacterium]
MERLEQIEKLNRLLLAEMPEYRQQAKRFLHTPAEQRRLLRSLMNLRPPRPLAPAFLCLQDELLSAEREKKGVIDGELLPAVSKDSRL